MIDADVIDRYPQVARQVRAFVQRNQDLLANIADPLAPGVQGRRLLSLVNVHKLRRILARMLDEELPGTAPNALDLKVAPRPSI